MLGLIFCVFMLLVDWFEFRLICRCGMWFILLRMVVVGVLLVFCVCLMFFWFVFGWVVVDVLFVVCVFVLLLFVLLFLLL